MILRLQMYVDNSLIRITKQVRKNIEAAKVEFDTFLGSDESTKNNRGSYKTNKLSDNFTEFKMGTSQENFVPSQISAETQNYDVAQSPDEKTSIVRSPENERSIKTNIQPSGTNEPSFDVNVHEISEVPANYNTKHDLRI